MERYYRYPMNLLGYDRLQTGNKEDAIELFKLNTEAYPPSTNGQDSLSDGISSGGEVRSGTGCGGKVPRVAAGRCE